MANSEAQAGALTAAPPPDPACASRLAAACVAAGNFCLDQFLPLILIAMVILGVAWPAPAIAASATPLSEVSVGGIFFIMGLGLNAAAVAALLGPRSRWALLAGLIAVLVLTPAAGLALAQLPLQPNEFALGLGLFWAMPTSASAGVMMVAAARGDAPLAVALTVLTNVIGVCTAPFWAAVILGAVVPVDVASLFARLTYTVLAPLAAGWALRTCVRGAPALAARHKLPLRMAQAFLLSLGQWSLMGQNAGTLSRLPGAQLALLCTAVLVAHAALLAACAAAAAALPSALAPGGRKQRTAIAIMPAQKTIILMSAIVVALPQDAGVAPGLLMLPAVLGHLTQTVFDSVLATLWGRRALRWEAAEEAAAAAAAGDAAAGAAAAVAAEAAVVATAVAAAPRWLAALRSLRPSARTTNMTRPEPSAIPPSEVHVTLSTPEGLRLRVPDGTKNGCRRAPSRTDATLASSLAFARLGPPASLPPPAIGKALAQPQPAANELRAPAQLPGLSV